MLMFDVKESLKTKKTQQEGVGGNKIITIIVIDHLKYWGKERNVDHFSVKVKPEKGPFYLIN